MIKLLAMAALTVLVSACAAVPAGLGANPAQAGRGSTESGAAKAAGLGFHGPLHRGAATDGPN